MTRSLLSNFVLCAAVVIALANGAGDLVGIAPRFPLLVFAAFALCCAALAPLARRHVKGPVLGAANSVTLFRLALTCMLAALITVPVSDPVLWFCIVTATVALLLDGLDGRLARRGGTQSRFGARFDMEVDALLILVLAVLCWHFERAGIWVLAAGLLRYLFVAAAWALPWLDAPLPDSLRRKTVCILQSALLLTCMGPIIPDAAAPWFAALGIALLVWSFGLDVRWLFERRMVPAS